jgi:hypothetical protein
MKKNRPKTNRRDYARNWARKNRYKRFGLTLEQIDSMLHDQGYLCPICKKSLKEFARHLDHDHKTGRVRAILCSRCNVGLGFVEDSEYLREAVLYLERHNNLSLAI